MATKESFMSIIRDVHSAIGHKGETKTFEKIQKTYVNVRKGGSKVANDVPGRRRRKVPGTSLNERGQVDLIDYPTGPDGDMHYKEYLTKFSVLRPLTQKLLAVLISC
jgi:hypothetical protein